MKTKEIIDRINGIKNACNSSNHGHRTSLIIAETMKRALASDFIQWIASDKNTNVGIDTQQQAKLILKALNEIDC